MSVFLKFKSTGSVLSEFGHNAVVQIKRKFPFLSKPFLLSLTSSLSVSHVTFSVFENGESLLLAGLWTHRRQHQASVNTRALLKTLLRVTNTPITVTHITRHILRVTWINICLCYGFIVEFRRITLKCVYISLSPCCSDVGLLFIVWKLS